MSKDYTVTIPVHLRDEFDAEATLAELKRSGCERVLLAAPRTIRNRRIDPDRFMDMTARIIPAYEAAGLEVGFWIGETMGHGGTLLHGTPSEEDPVYQPFVNISGNACRGSFCCADPLFREDVCRWAANAARSGAKLILLDDDYRMSSHGPGGPSGCLCPHHVKRYCELIGEELSSGEIVRRVFTGAGNNKYRDAWRTLMGGDMLSLAAEIRAAVDIVAPECRIGLCTAPSVVDFDGAPFTRIAEVLAGDTRPFLRLIGAPYWAKNGADLSAVIAMERMEAHFAAEWQKRTNAEVLLEGDVYPRPRFATPAAYLEAADLACRADGAFTGAMKYMIDYVSTPTCETGYIDRHMKNAVLAAQVEDAFRGKRQTGIRPYEYRTLFPGMDLPEDPAAANRLAYEFFRGVSLRSLTDASVPVSFEDGVPAVFGENAKYVPADAVRRGAILDASAAMILRGRGIDVGVTEVVPAGGNISPEYFPAENERVTLRAVSPVRMTVSPEAEILSRFADGSPSAILCTNGEGAVFGVFAVAVKPWDGSAFFRSYPRQRQIVQMAERIAGKPLAAFVTGHPDMYVAVSEDADETAVLLLNLFPDEADNVTAVVHGKPYDAGTIAPFGAKLLRIKRGND